MKMERFEVQALGTVKLKGKTTEAGPSREKLLSPLTPNSGMMLYCSFCGSYMPLKRVVIELIEELEGKKYSASEYYAESKSCPLCKGRKKGIELKPIPEV